MLILTRRKGESILIGEDIEIKVLETGNQTTIGIIAPDEVHIVRSELLDRAIDCRRDDCEWVDATNKVVSGGEVCLTCNKIRAFNVGNE